MAETPFRRRHQRAALIVKPLIRRAPRRHETRVPRRQFAPARKQLVHHPIIHLLTNLRRLLRQRLAPRPVQAHANVALGERVQQHDFRWHQPALANHVRVHKQNHGINHVPLRQPIVMEFDFIFRQVLQKRAVLQHLTARAGKRDVLACFQNAPRNVEMPVERSPERFSPRITRRGGGKELDHAD